MRVLVIGVGGQVANAVVAAAPAEHQVMPRTQAELDICDATAVARALADTGAEWAVNGAAYTAVDLAEDEPSLAAAVNDTATGVLAAATASAGCRLLHLSTDFVFDGKSNRAYLPTDEAHPLSVYGVEQAWRRAACVGRPRDRHRVAHGVGIFRRGPEFRAHHAASDA